MRYSRSAFNPLSIAVLLAMFFLFVSCSGGGGGGDGDGGGVTYDNARLNGAYTYVAMGNTGGFSVEVGTITFDGAGNGVYSAATHSATGSVTYTVTTDNTITIHDPGAVTSFVGTLRSGGSFFVGTDTTKGNEVMIAAVKQSAQVTDTMTTYLAGQFEYEIPRSQTGLVSVVTSSPDPGTITVQNLFTHETNTFPYILSAATGNITFPTVDVLGAISADNALMIFGDGKTTIDPSMMGGCGFKLPGSGMTAASLNGTFMVYQFRDDNVGIGAFVTTRSQGTFDGAGHGTYAEIANSTGTVDPGGTFTYIVSPDGRFLLDGVTPGVIIQDGSVFGAGDYDDSDGSVAIMIGVKQ